MFSIPAILLYILFFVLGWLFARWRGAQQATQENMASVAESPKPEITKPDVAPKSSAASSSVAESSKTAASTSTETKSTPKPDKPSTAKDAVTKPKSKTTKPKTAGKPIVSSDPHKPERLAAARDGKADDLKRVKGIGPANEKKLNAFGIYHFDQVANWTAEQAEWIGKELSFPGRIEREDWIEQAKVLASGGDTEFSKRADKR